MKIVESTPPRAFEVKSTVSISLKDCAHIQLDAFEQITLVSESGSEYDIARMPWGYYATPSLNSRLKSFGLRALLIKSVNNRFFIFLVEKGKEPEMLTYIEDAGHEIVAWMDDDQALNEVDRSMKASLGERLDSGSTPSTGSNGSVLNDVGKAIEG